MAFVPVPKDLSKVKTKVALNLTRRQLISFSLGGLVGFVIYTNTKKLVPSDIALLIMMAGVLPFFFLGVYEKDGLTFEKLIKYYYESKIRNPEVRIYKNENSYEALVKGADLLATNPKSAAKKANKQTTKKQSRISA